MTFQVTFNQSTTRFLVEEDELILDAAIRQGIGLPYGCRDGECGSCIGQVSSGQVSYKKPPAILTPDEQDLGFAVFCQAYAKSDLILNVKELRHTKDVPLKKFPAKIKSIKHLSHDVMQIIMSLSPTVRMQFFAGQYINFILDDGRRRSFSIANAPHEDKHIELHVRHIQGGEFTGEIFDNMKPKDIVRIEGPLGSFFLREDSDRPAILMAGGTGFAPIKGIIEHALNKNIKREFHIYWGAKSLTDLYFHEQVKQWASENENITYTPILDNLEQDPDWQGQTGYVHDAVLKDFNDFSDVEVYASGPPVMVYAGRDAFVPYGMNPERYYSDAFEFSND